MGKKQQYYVNNKQSDKIRWCSEISLEQGT